MQKKENNFAFIDGQNLNLGVREIGWKIDFRKFRTYLGERLSVKKAYYFIGYVEGNSDLYASLQEAGYILIFKPTFKNKDGKLKGNCDAELVLQAMIDYNKYEKAIIVSGDGDFYCLIKFLIEREKLLTVIVPNKEKYSALIKKAAKGNITCVNDLKNKIEHIKEKTP